MTDKATAKEIKEILASKGLDAEIKMVDEPTFHALHQVLLTINASKVQVAVFENDAGMVSLTSGIYHLSVWSGLPLVGRKLHTMTWQPRESAVINSKIAEAVL